MDEKILAYRKRHKRCRYCKYYTARYYKTFNIIDGFFCKLKSKEIVDTGRTGCFCRWYEPKEE